MTKINSSPNIRFKNFTNAWEQRKLRDITKRVTRKNKNLESDLPLTISAELGLIDQREYFNRAVASRDLSNYLLVKNGEFAYNKSYSEGYPMGAIKRLNDYDYGVLSTLYIVFKPTQISSDYLEKYYDGNQWHREVSKYAAEGARNHGLLNISPSDFFETIVKYPNNIKEQEQIGSFFKELDNLITLHQRKLEQLQLAKKTFLNKLLPKNKDKIPEIRFEEYSDEWELRRLEDLGEISTGNTPPTTNESYWSKQAIDDGHVWITPTDIDSLYIGDSERKLTDKGWSKARTVPINSVLITSIASIGKNAINTVPAAFNQQINAIVPKDNNSYFILYSMIRNSNRFASLAGQTATAIINKSTFEKFEIYVSNIEEQKQIGLLFKEIDNLITLHQRKLEILEKSKKYYLKHMFV